MPSEYTKQNPVTKESTNVESFDNKYPLRNNKLEVEQPDRDTGELLDKPSVVFKNEIPHPIEDNENKNKAKTREDHHDKSKGLMKILKNFFTK